MARNPRSNDGSAPAIGELSSEASGTRPRNDPVTPAGFSESNFGSGPSADDYRRHAQAAAAAAAVNAGAPDGSGPVPGLEDFIAGKGSGGTFGTCADPSSLTSQG